MMMNLHTNRERDYGRLFSLRIKVIRSSVEKSACGHRRELFENFALYNKCTLGAKPKFRTGLTHSLALNKLTWLGMNSENTSQGIARDGSSNAFHDVFCSWRWIYCYAFASMMSLKLAPSQARNTRCKWPQCNSWFTHRRPKR